MSIKSARIHHQSNNSQELALLSPWGSQDTRYFFPHHTGINRYYLSSVRRRKEDIPLSNDFFNIVKRSKAQKETYHRLNRVHIKLDEEEIKTNPEPTIKYAPMRIRIHKKIPEKRTIQDELLPGVPLGLSQGLPQELFIASRGYHTLEGRGLHTVDFAHAAQEMNQTHTSMHKAKKMIWKSPQEQDDRELVVRRAICMDNSKTKRRSKLKNYINDAGLNINGDSIFLD